LSNKTMLGFIGNLITAIPSHKYDENLVISAKSRSRVTWQFQHNGSPVYKQNHLLKTIYQLPIYGV